MDEPRLQYVVVDAFAEPGVPFTGNAVAVVFLPSPAAPWPSDAFLGKLCAELAVSNTAFVRARAPAAPAPPPAPPAAAGYDVRFWSPLGGELNACGHAALAAAFALWATGAAPAPAPLLLHTRSGAVAAAPSFAPAPATPAPAPAAVCGAVLDLPALPPSEPAFDAPRLAALQSALRTAAPPVLICAVPALGDLLVLLPDAEAVRSAAPDFDLLAAQLGPGGRGVAVTAAVGPADTWAEGCAFVCRWWAPASRVEDACTGSAALALAPFWAARLLLGGGVAGGVAEVAGMQLSARTGRLRARVAGGAGAAGGWGAGARVALAGDCVVALRGEVVASPSAMLV